MGRVYRLVVIIVLLMSFDCFSQEIIFKGKLVEAKSNISVPYATIGVFNKATNELINSNTTNSTGVFTVVSSNKEVYLEISFIGFETKVINEFKEVSGLVDLGVIMMVEVQHNLSEVNVQAERSTTEFKLDKRVFNVGKDLSSSGASALEVLGNVPSVNVSIEGDISLRGGMGTQILINGKPSVIASEQGNALGTITADMIEKIEVITNPSAKYEAEGSSGIINIILKKEERKGLNGSVSLNLGQPHNHSLGLSLNRRTEKFNLFSQLGAGYRSLPRYNKNSNQDLITGALLSSEGTEYRNEQFYNFILGTDYHLNAQNVITVSGSYALEVEDQPSATQFSYLKDGEVTSWERSESTEALNPKYQYEVQYVNDFKNHKEHKLLVSAIGNFFGKDLHSNFMNAYDSGLESQQNTRTNFSEQKSTYKIDYTNPITDNFTIESGSQYLLQDVQNDYSVSDYQNNIWVVDSGLTNIFDYKQNVLGVYATAAYEKKKVGVKGGIRMEHTDLSTLLYNTQEKNKRDFINFFPSLHLSYKLTKSFSLQGGYSKRIYRPRLWDLNPFFNIRNNFSVRTGNPNLNPQFTDLYEISSVYRIKGASFNFSVFQRREMEVIERVSVFDNNVTVFKPLNIGTKNATGFELNSKIIAHENLIINGNVNYHFFQRVGNFDTMNFDFFASNWDTRWTIKIKLPKDVDVEVTGRYISPVQTFQSTISQQAFANIGLRKKVLKGKGVVNISVRDVFVTRIRETVVNQADFTIYSRGYRGRFVTLGMSYGFGKGEAMEFVGKRRY